jgi:DHA1 family bicyclomycin/chloramphenicol resistance-like MFS transporter
MPDKPLSPPIWILVVATATGPLALNIFVPSMPGLVRVFDTDYATIQLTLTLYLVGVAVAQLAYGPLSDRFGRRPTLLAGLAIYAIASLLCAFAWSIETLIVGRILQAVGGCAGMVLGRAIVRDVFERDRAASEIALVTIAMAVAPAMAPALGGFLESSFGWHSTFLVPMAMGLVVLVASIPLLHETNLTPIPRIDLPSMLRSYGELLRSRAFLGYAGNTATSVGAFFAFLAGGPYVVIEILHRPPSEYGLYFVLISGGYMTGNFMASRMSQRLGVDRMIPLGVGVSTVGGLASVGLLVAVGNGISQPNGIAGAVSVNPRIAGAASGLMGFGQMATGAVFTIVVGLLQNQTDHRAMAGMILFACIASFFFHLLARSDGRMR